MRKLASVCMGMGLAVSLGLSVAAKEAAPRQVSGMVLRATPTTLELREGNERVETIVLTPDTKYRKWILIKPWQQDSRVGVQALQPGVRVRADVKPGATPTAETVWIVMNRPGA